jgi:hypothetical protein
MAATGVKQQVNRVLEGHRSPPSEEHSVSIGQTADLWLLAVSLGKFARVLDRLAFQRDEHHPIRAVSEEFGRALPDLRHVRNVLEHSEDYLRAFGGSKRNQELGSIEVALTSQDIIIAVALKDDPKQRFLSVLGAALAVDDAMEAIHGRRHPTSRS